MHDDLNQNTVTPPPKPPKLGGWLIIVSISLNLSLIQLAAEIVKHVKLLSFSLISEAHSMIIYNLLINSFLFIAVIYLLVLMYMKKKFFIESVIAFLVFIICENILSYFLFKSLSAELNSYLTERMITVFIAGVSLIGYFANSGRVRTTFIT